MKVMEQFLVRILSYSIINNILKLKKIANVLVRISKALQLWTLRSKSWLHYGWVQTEVFILSFFNGIREHRWGDPPVAPPAPYHMVCSDL